MRRGLAQLPRWPTLLLALVNAVALWACVEQLWHGSGMQSILATQALAIPAPSALLDPVPHQVNLADIQSAALFYESRSFYTPPVIPQVRPPPDYTLSGTLVIPKQPTLAMLIRGQSGARIKVRAGDDLEGWSVESIQAQGVLLRHGEQQFEIRPKARADVSGMRMIPLSEAPRPTRPAGTGVRVLGSPLPPSSIR